MGPCDLGDRTQGGAQAGHRTGRGGFPDLPWRGGALAPQRGGVVEAGNGEAGVRIVWEDGMFFVGLEMFRI